MAFPQIGGNGCKDSHFHNGIQPWLVCEKCDIQNYGATVECNDVGIFHKRQALSPEFATEVSWYNAVVLIMDIACQFLETGGKSLLCPGITDVAS